MMATRELVAALRSGQLAVLEAYLDESFSNGTSRVFVMAGWLGDGAAWREFEMKWQKVLRSAPRRITEFKTSDCHNRQGEFKNWTEKQCSRLLNDLVASIIASNISGVISILFLDGDSPRRNSDYMLSIEHCLIRLALLADEAPKGERVAYIVDEKDRVKAEVETARLNLKRSILRPRYALRVGPLSFEDSREWLPLQAADLLAGEAFRAVRPFMPVAKRWEDPAPEPPNRYTDLDNKIKYRTHYWWNASTRRLRVWRGKRWYIARRAQANHRVQTPSDEGSSPLP